MAVGFHAQQYLEKLLKAVLVANRVIFRRTHDLIELAELIRQNEIPLPAPVERLARLNPFAVSLRYDDVDFELPQADLQEMMALMDLTRVWVQEQIDKPSQDE